MMKVGGARAQVSSSDKVCCPGTISPTVKSIITMITSALLVFVKLVQYIGALHPQTLSARNRTLRRPEV